MKKLLILFTVLILISLKTNAQIPNNGFEIWENYPDPDNSNNVYQKPDQWVGLLPNSPSTYSFSIEKNMDNYPAGTGQYSMIIKPDSTNEVDGAAFSWDSLPPGISWQNIPPAFPINYRPTSLFLYYKYLPENGDSMRVACNFYKDGVVIGGFDYNSPQIVPNWTLLEIPISFYTSDIPDSATIILTTFCNTQHNGSSLYIDNLSFDTSITSVENTVNSLPQKFTLYQNYPNPFNPSTTIKFQIPNTKFTTLKVYNILGKEVTTLVSTKLNQGNHTYIFDGKNLASGIYYYQIVAGNFYQVKKMVLIK